MRRILAFAAALLVSACASTPTPQPTRPQPAPVVPHERGDLIGLTASELIQRLGTPALQIREGTSLKVQFRGRGCVLDAFLYPGAGAQHRVTHVETRGLNGIDVPQPGCISDIEYSAG